MVELQSSDRATASLSGYVTDRFHQATTLLPSGSGDTAAQAALRMEPSPTVVRPTATRTAKTNLAVEQAIARRRSPLRFREAPIQRDELRFVADMAVGNAALRQTPGLRLYVIAHRVRDLPAGLYRVDPVTRELGLLEQRNMARALTRACRRQQHARLSAAAFLMVGSFAPDAPELGDRSYRDLLMESGVIAERIYLAAESSNLAARNLAAFTDITLNHLVGLDGRSEAVLHLTVLGHRPV